MAQPILPDPTSDLQWSSWNGAMHEIFHRNALSHPERPCVVETSPRRDFSYKQIDQASNVLAQHFVSRGVERGDVIMIYAYRGVDLVIAIMGTLKAGATFSVIDPAYPPDRQIIYLDVSRPRALVVIGKAKGGGLSTPVTDWIKANLDLKATVPSLRLNDDGSVIGGALEGKDVLDDAQAKKASLPGVVVGPDSNPTLSFTSGSEGRPKGVLGRHFSLVHYFPWMAEKFGLSQNDRFTMLSGISHDPIQRDIFTPLFLGAQIIVPSPEDIQHEKLAEWMKEHKTTVTHLTPAMGQILVGGATAQFPDLKNAFFVGDILIKRDVRRLQELAPNVRAINMFGTTETQRAVSYFAIPSRNDDPGFLEKLGDRIPAGKGMSNVQLLVVDRNDRQRICNVGEQGEIYVRAAGLAEGYLGLDDITKAKFVPSWFVAADKWTKLDEAHQQSNGAPPPWREFYKGPRDRLYRSGDLGHYTETGDVECTGRIDSQVKIRGFRIELGEIDTHLSHHPIVRENVTLTRRDKDEEHMLVSYVVPEMSKWPAWLAERGLSDQQTDNSMPGMLKRFIALREALRDYLKTKVPWYAVPPVIITLDRMPLNPNGKVDKPALPFPNPDELGAALPRRPSVNLSGRSPTEQSLAEIWGNVMDGVPSRTIAANDSFFDLGGHSLSAQRMLLQVRKKWGSIDILMQSIYDYPTLRGFAAEIDRALDPQGRVLGFENETRGTDAKQDVHYMADAKQLAEKSLPKQFPTGTVDASKSLTVLMTGTTGFLGAFMLANILERPQNMRVIAHVRAKDAAKGLERVKGTCMAYGIWSPSWSERLECVTGDLEAPRLGIEASKWDELAQTVDLIISNGARVHWVSPYSTLRAANVLSTLALIELAAKGKHKQMTFISSTSAVDTEHYIRLSDNLQEQGRSGIPESDDLSGSAQGLGTGYGQTKWASEYIMREAGRHGLAGCVVRPGYVLGDSRRGTSITDDFLIRMLKGCVQLSCRPAISNTVNMVPVDGVAATAVACALHPPTAPLGVANIAARPRLTFSEFLGALPAYGFDVPEVPYATWRDRLEAYVAEHGDHALLPLLHFVTSDLPANTKAPVLDDANAMAALRKDKGSGERVAVTQELVGKYLSYLVAVEFLAKPKGGAGKPLPEVGLAAEQKEALERLGGRGALGG